MCVLIQTSPSVELMLSGVTPLKPFFLLGEWEEVSVMGAGVKQEKKATITQPDNIKRYEQCSYISPLCADFHQFVV